MGTNKKILFVDDEENILKGLRLSLRKHFKVDIALGPKEGLKKILESSPLAVVVSDLKMPGMDGLSFLNEVKKLSPKTVRVMLSGHADLNAAVSAVNEGLVFRFLTKPSPTDEMIRTLNDCIEQHAFISAEQELLLGTLKESVKVLTGILGLADPGMFGRIERVRRLTAYVGREMLVEDPLFLELAAMLSGLGCVALPEVVKDKLHSGEELTEEETQVYNVLPSVTSELFAKIPRMDKVAELILHQRDGLTDAPEQPLEARILKGCLDYDQLFQRGMAKQKAIKIMRMRAGEYDPKVVDVLERDMAEAEGYVRREVAPDELRAGMILEAALSSLDGVQLMGEGMEFNTVSLMRIVNFGKGNWLPETVRVLVPLEQPGG